MPFGCFGPSSAVTQLQEQLDQAKAQLSTKEREAADLKRRNEEAGARHARAQRAAIAESERNVNLLGRQLEELTAALQEKEREATETSTKLHFVLIEAAELKKQLENERTTAEQAKTIAAAAQARIEEYEKRLHGSESRLRTVSEELATAQKEAVEASTEVSAAREDASSARKQLAKAVAELSKTISDTAAEAHEAAAKQVRAASVTAAEMVEKVVNANRQEIESLKAELATQQAKLLSAEQATVELHTLHRHAQITAQAELTSMNELRKELSERLAQSHVELENAYLSYQSLEEGRQMLADHLDNVTADHARLKAHIQELEGTLLENALDAVAATENPTGTAGAHSTDAEADVVSSTAVAPHANSRSADGACAGEDDFTRLELLDNKALAVQLLAAKAEAHDLRKELQQKIVGHAEEEILKEKENEVMKDRVKAAVAVAESKIRELEAMQAMIDELNSQLRSTQAALEDARSSVEALRLEIVSLELDRAALRSQEDKAQAEVAKLQQQLKNAQMRAVELVSANADLQVEKAKLRSEVLSQGMLSDSNTQMATKLLTDYQALKDEHTRLRGELRRKDEMMALLQEQLSSLTEIDLDSMLRQIEHVQMRKPSKKSVVATAAPVEAMLAAAGLTGKQPGSLATGGGSTVSTPSGARAAVAGANGNGAYFGTAETIDHLAADIGPWNT